MRRKILRIIWLNLKTYAYTVSDWNMSDGVDKVVYLLKSKWLKAVISSVSGHYTFMALPTEYVNKFPLLFCHNKHIIGSLSDSMLFQLHCGFILHYCDTVTHCVGSSNCITFEIYGQEWILASFVSHMSNDNGFVKVTLTEFCHFHKIVQVYKILHHLVYRKR